MTITNQHVADIAAAYLNRYPDSDLEHLAPLMDLIAAGGDITSRHHLPGHVTCSAAVINPAGQVIHIHHNALQKWLLPGGHCENHDITLTGAGLREVHEETGIRAEWLTEWGTESFSVVDINIHPIPANPAKGEPAHWHADFRHIYRLTKDADIDLQSEEVSGFVWLNPAEREPSQLTTRLIELATVKS